MKMSQDKKMKESVGDKDLQSRNLFVSIWEFISIVWAWVSSLWRQSLSFLNAWVMDSVPAIVHRGGDFSNTLLVLGDDIAFGYGDSFGLGQFSGLTRALKKELSIEVGIKQQWKIYNCGVMGSTSRDWLPTSSKSEDMKKKTWFERTFAKQKYLDCSIVIIMLGFQDARKGISPDDTIDHIHAIAKVLSNMGKKVFICTIPTYGDSEKDSSYLEENMRRNDLLCDIISERPEKDPIQLGPRIDALNFEYRNPRLYFQDPDFFNAKGYTKLAKDFIDVLKPVMIKLEFEKFKKHLRI